MFVRKPLNVMLSFALVAIAGGAQAADTYFDNFTPLAASAGVAANAAMPITLSSANFSQVSIADRTTQLALGEANPGNWDMIAMNTSGPAAGRYLFMPFEQFDATNPTAGVQRIDLLNGFATKTIVAPGTLGFTAGDASRWTPWGSYLTAEENFSSTTTSASNTKGRLFEITNPTADVGSINFVQRSILPSVSHEGLAFDSNKNLYFIDELNGGGIYKYTSANANATNGDDYFAAGQTFALKVGAGANSNATGAYTWAAITDANGVALAGVNLTSTGAVDGRQAQDAIASTAYNRPEDMDITNLANGDEALFVATTGTNEVYLTNLTTGEMSVFASANTIDLATGLAVGSTAFTNPDNIAIDGEGNIYIIEDRNGGVDNDIWFAKDINHDGDLNDAGEGVARWASNGTPGSEFTGLFFDPTNPNVAYVNIQHPSTGVDRTMMITAVPEAETYAMMLAGLGLVGFMAKRRQAQNS
ncbi:MAG: sorting protein [Proteobacteria bacterium]|nr:sorting protein [Pseudomonadota bacterium]